MYNILILGNGGREHALAWKISQSKICKKLFIGPGNAGTAEVGQNIVLDITNFDDVKAIVDNESIDFLIVGPEAPLVNGIEDFFRNHKVKVFGPSKIAAQLEGSKAFANDFMEEFKIPTAGYLTVNHNNLEEGYDFIDKQPTKIVLKADGLAAGKGVLILDDKNEAKEELNKMLAGKFGEASAQIVIEEFLDGIEFSVFVLTNGYEYKILPIAKDYKRIGEGDTGLNTGGMGAVSPVPFVDEILMKKVKERIINPTIEGLKKRKYKYEGVIFLGLIKVEDEPYVIEYNCRFGDPETEVIIPRLKNDFVEVLEALFDNKLDKQQFEFRNETAATVMLVSGGYPEKYEKGKLITLDKSIADSIVFHAGTLQGQYDLKTNGGRVIAVTSLGADHKEAVAISKRNISKIHFDKMTYRQDIGFDL